MPKPAFTATQREHFSASTKSGVGPMTGFHPDFHGAGVGRAAPAQVPIVARWLRERTDAYLRIRLSETGEETRAEVVSRSDPHSPVSGFVVDLLRAEGHEDRNGRMTLVETKRTALYVRYRLLTAEERAAMMQASPPDLFALLDYAGGDVPPARPR